MKNSLYFPLFDVLFFKNIMNKTHQEIRDTIKLIKKNIIDHQKTNDDLGNILDRDGVQALSDGSFFVDYSDTLKLLDQAETILKSKE